ncbi:SMP-30/gluconolactonase/LRE family protein [Paenarthrobacter nicotinovorans]|uniref:SMP-30/gluconolactonase/LRE family protein n=1 Tax=Paenarthrobacter nicotinovorans TaxID=29320 RepID=UPI0037493FD8
MALWITASLVLTSCSADDNQTNKKGTDRSAPRQQEATELMKVTDPHSASGGTLLEGPTFSESGYLYVVDVMAPPGEAKVLRIDVEERSVENIYTDEESTYTSAQFGPTDGRLYLTDFNSGAVHSITPDGKDRRVVFEGPVDGIQMLPDDIAFDENGNLFVTDTNGVLEPGWESPGRVIRIGTDGQAAVLAAHLPSPNGITFDENYDGLWVGQYNANRIDYLGLDESRTRVISSYPGIHVDGGRARVDSTAVDGAGNIYQAFHNKPEIAVYSPTGALLATIVAPNHNGALDSATNIAIRPGTTDGYATISGPGGGYIYTFDALATGTRQSNGG